MVVVDVIKVFLTLLVVFTTQLSWGQQTDSLSLYKKKVLEKVEVDMLMSYYEQEGTHAAVTGGIGNEHLTDYTPTIVVRMPIGKDAVLTADVGLSAYTSASSSNGNPFNKSGASGGGYEDEDENEDDEDDDYDEDDDDEEYATNGPPQGSPWITSSGASGKDVLTTLNVNYQKASQDRNTYWGISLGGSTEYDYESLNGGLSFAQLWNEKNTEFSASAQVFFDRWKPVIPTELHEYETFDSTFLYNTDSYFYGVSIFDNTGAVVATYAPDRFTSFSFTHRNSYSFSVRLSQVLHSNIQAAIFTDLTIQNGLLSNPLQRVYFQDKRDYYVGNFRTLDRYADTSNVDLFHLADDVERLPHTRVKLPIGSRVNFYLNENVVVRTYARYYQDSWGIKSHTFQVELPVKLNFSWRFTPIFRYYAQTAAEYFKPYNQHLSSNTFYTSDYDLSQFTSHQWGMSISYRSVFSSFKLLDFGLKSAQIRAQNYQRSDGLSAFIVSSAFRFVLD